VVMVERCLVASGGSLTQSILIINQQTEQKTSLHVFSTFEKQKEDKNLN